MCGRPTVWHDRSMAQPSTTDQQLDRNYTRVIVTGSDDDVTMTTSVALVGGRTAVQVAAAKPADPAVFPVLLDRVVAQLVQTGSGPTAALGVAGQVVRHTPWAGYRTGRSRLASSAAAYLRWMAPPEDWAAGKILKVSGRTGFTWVSPDGELIVDLLDVGDVDGHTLAAALYDHGTARAEALGGGVRLVGVRLMRLSNPTSSVLCTTRQRQVLLTTTPYWFEASR